jgi:hypothetical protein
MLDEEECAAFLEVTDECAIGPDVQWQGDC